MAQFVFVYYSSADPNAEVDESIKQAWGAWFGELGDKLVDGGSPFAGNGKAVEKSGVSDIDNFPATGYSIVNADSIDAATELAKGSPVLEAPDGAVRVYEKLPM